MTKRKYVVEMLTRDEFCDPECPWLSKDFELFRCVLFGMGGKTSEIPVRDGKLVSCDECVDLTASIEPVEEKEEAP